MGREKRIDTNQILADIHREYGGSHQKIGSTKMARVEFVFHDRKFVVCPDITEVQRSLNAMLVKVSGICIYCDCRKDLPFWIRKEGWRHKLLRKLRMKKDLFCEDKESGGSYLLKCRDSGTAQIISKSHPFLQAFKPLAQGMHFLNQDAGTLWYAAEDYRPGSIEDLEQLVNVLETLES